MSRGLGDVYKRQVYSTGEENRVADVEHIPWVERELMVMREVRELQ